MLQFQGWKEDKYTIFEDLCGFYFQQVVIYSNAFDLFSDVVFHLIICCHSNELQFAKKVTDQPNLHLMRQELNLHKVSDQHKLENLRCFSSFSCRLLNFYFPPCFNSKVTRLFVTQQRGKKKIKKKSSPIFPSIVTHPA